MSIGNRFIRFEKIIKMHLNRISRNLDIRTPFHITVKKLVKFGQKNLLAKWACLLDTCRK